MSVTIGHHLCVPAKRIPAEQVADHFKSFTPFMTLDIPISSADTQRLLDWGPCPGLIADLDNDHYFTTG